MGFDMWSLLINRGGFIAAVLDLFKLGLRERRKREWEWEAWWQRSNHERVDEQALLNSEDVIGLVHRWVEGIAWLLS